MKLWEVIKELTEDPTKKFEISDKDSMERIVSDGNYLWYSKTDNGISSSGAALEDDVDLNNNNWQLVRQPVTCQEAIQAWGAGKTVSVDVGGCKIKLTHDDSIFGLSKRMINLGTWYVED